MKFSIVGVFLFFIGVSLAAICAGHSGTTDAASRQQSAAKDFINRILLPELARVEALEANSKMDDWVPGSSDSLKSIVTDCSSSSIETVKQAYQKAQSMATRAIAVQKMVKERGSLDDLPLKERSRYFEGHAHKHYPTSKILCISLSSAYDRILQSPDHLYP